jgi:hypothetical protein
MIVDRVAGRLLFYTEDWTHGGMAFATEELAGDDELYIACAIHTDAKDITVTIENTGWTEKRLLLFAKEHAGVLQSLPTTLFREVAGFL